jgi:hypothetical protein
MLIQNHIKDSKDPPPGYSYNINEIRDYNKVRQLMKKEKMSSQEDQSQSHSHYTHDPTRTFYTDSQNPQNPHHSPSSPTSLNPHDWADQFLTPQNPNPDPDPSYPYSDFSHSYVNKQFGSKESSPPNNDAENQKMELKLENEALTLGILQEKLHSEFFEEKANFLEGRGLGGEVRGNKFDLDPNEYGYANMKREVENSAFNILREGYQEGAGGGDPREFFESAFQEQKVSGENDYSELIRKNNHSSANEFLGSNSHQKKEDY